MQAFGRRCFALLYSHRTFIVCLLALLSVFGLWWLAFYPGVMTADSLDQWRQAISGDYNDAHPFTSTLYMNVFRWINDTPAWVSLSQVVLTSTIVASFLAYARSRAVPRKAIGIVLLLFMTWPVYGIYSVTIWKDIVYSIFILAASLATYVIVVDHRIAQRTYPYVILAVFCALIPLWRHNGLIYLVLPFIVLALTNLKQRKKIILSGCAAILVYIIMHFGVASIMGVKQAPILVEWLRMKTVAAVYNEKHPTIRPEDRAVFSSLMPEDEWRSAYRCHHTDTTFMQFYTHHPISFTDHVSPNPKTEAAWKKAVNTTALHNPTAVAKDHLCVGKMLLSSKDGFIKYSDAIYVTPTLPYVQERPLLHTAGVKAKLKAGLQESAKKAVPNFIFWSAIPAAITLLTCLGFAIRHRHKGTIILALLALANPLCVMLIGSSSDYRYIYSLLLTAPLLPVAYLIESSSARKRIARLKINRQSLMRHRAFIGIFLTASTIFMAWWLAFYPGGMNGDSLDQWRQAVLNKYNDAHPFMSSYYVNIFRWISDTPAWVGIVNIVGMSLLIASILSYALRKGVSKYVVGGTLAFFLLMPAYGIYTVTIWKDIVYSIALTAISFLVFVAITNDRLSKKWYLYALLGFCMTVAALWRHNGLVYFAIVPLCIIVFRRSAWKAISMTALASIAVFFFVTTLVFGWAKVEKAPIGTEWLRMKNVAAVYQEKHPTISQSEREIFTSFMPESAWRKGYRCNHTDTTFMMFYKYRPIGYLDTVSPNPKIEAAWARSAVTASINNPQAIIKDRLCVTKTLLSSKGGEIKYVYGVPQRSDMPAIAHGPALHTGWLHTFLLTYLSWSSFSLLANMAFWNAVPYLLLVLIGTGLAIRRKAWGTMTFGLLAVSNPLIVAIVGASSEYRYIYSLVLSAPFIIVLYLVESKQRARVPKPSRIKKP